MTSLHRPSVLLAGLFTCLLIALCLLPASANNGSAPGTALKAQVNNAQNPPFHGYIVQLPSPSILGNIQVRQSLYQLHALQVQREGARNQLAAFSVRPGSHDTNAQSQLVNTVNAAEKAAGDMENTVRDLSSSQAATIATQQREVQGRIANVLNTAGNALQVSQSFSVTFNGFTIDNTLTIAGIQQIEQFTGVKLYPNYEVRATLNQSVPFIHADQVWTKNAQGQPCDPQAGDCITGKGVTIGIIDTGIDYTHPDLGGCFGNGCKVTGGYDIVNNDSNPMDDQGHGTHVASIAAGNGTLKGVAPDATLYAYKVLDSQGSGTMDGVIAGIERAMDPNQDGNLADHVQIINLSLGCPAPACNENSPASVAVNNAVDVGIVAVVAAGNEGQNGENTIGSPGAARRGITVAAVDLSNIIAYFSSHGPTSFANPKPDVSAPGVQICAARAANTSLGATCIDTVHVRASGTSMATPHVAGLAALMLQAHPTWTPDSVKRTMKNATMSFDASQIPSRGYGTVDALQAVFASAPAPALNLDTSGTVTGIIDINGSIGLPSIAGYDVLLQAGDTSPTLLYHGTTLPTNSHLFSGFNSDTLTPGTRYFLILAVTETSGRVTRMVTILYAGSHSSSSSSSVVSSASSMSSSAVSSSHSSVVSSASSSSSIVSSSSSHTSSISSSSHSSISSSSSHSSTASSTSSHYAFLPPTPQSPSGPITTAKPTFTWTGPVGALRYALNVRDVTTNTNAINGVTVTGISYTPTASLVRNHAFTWKVAVINTSGVRVSDWSTDMSFSITQYEFSPPVPQSPSGQITTAKPTFTWTAIERITRYIVIVRDLHTNTNVINGAIVTGTSFTPAGSLTRNHAFSWKVAAINTSGVHVSEWSTDMPFSITQYEFSPPALQSPNGTISQTKPTFTLTGVTGANRYVISAKDLTTNTNAISNATFTGTSFTPTGNLLKGHSYSWKAAVINGNGSHVSDWSAEMGFSIAH